jgi:hypothetical protein
MKILTLYFCDIINVDLTKKASYQCNLILMVFFIVQLTEFKDVCEI